ncbi:MAG: hypothetical protein QF893_00440 [Alphaproteobacteria bacterium]|jgi:hypothetical protein|nr:hypothetical protein [Alphaproteobacteria bacterium]
MTQSANDDLEAMVRGLMLVQQVTLEALVRHDAMGYPQARETLAQALAALEAAGDVEAAALLPLRAALETLDQVHHPRDPGDPPKPIDWVERLRRAGGA